MDKRQTDRWTKRKEDKKKKDKKKRKKQKKACENEKSQSRSGINPSFQKMGFWA